MLWQKLMISIFLNGRTCEECEPASAFHKTPPVFLVLCLLYRTESSMSNNSPVSSLRQLIFLVHREFESLTFTCEILMLIMHTCILKIFDHSLMAMASNLSFFSRMWLSTGLNSISGQWELRRLHPGAPWHCVCNSGRGLFWWGFPFVWKLHVFLGLS